MQITALPPCKFKVTPDLDIFHTQEKNLQEKKLVYRCSQIAWNILSVIIFPIGIARLLVYSIKQYAPTYLLPSATWYNLQKNQKAYLKAPTSELSRQIQKIERLDKEREDFLSSPLNHATQHTIETADGALLDAITIETENQLKLPPEEQKWIIFFQSNATCYEICLEPLKDLAKRAGANVLVGNYRGVMRSQGAVSSSHHLVLDGESMVQHLIKTGVPAKNIIAHGWSMGGGVATEVASKHQEVGDEMHLCSERSFSSISEAIKARFPNIIGGVLSTLVHAAGWQFDSVSNFLKIKGKKFTIYSKEDSVICHSASVYKRVKESQMTKEDRALKQKKTLLRKEGQIPQKKENKAVDGIRFSFDILRENGSAYTPEEVHKHFGVVAHCYPIFRVDHVFEAYIARVQESLGISNSANAA